jgi:hypothetical protein
MPGPYLAAAPRKQLAKTVDQARVVATKGVTEAIRRLGVAEAKPPAHLNEEARRLRNALRAHGRALGDRRDPSGAQAVEKLIEAAAYEHWHRMLFARFLAERKLLIHPEHKVHVTIEDCRELAVEEALPDAWSVAERYATRMLPAIFRPDDSVLALHIAPEHAQALQRLVTDLETAVFEASDSLGWTYQFWRAAEKEAVNASGRKIGGNELPAVTQLFTEPYMVQFLLHNTLGAWWAGKVLAEKPDLARSAPDEASLRAACALPGLDWEFLRFVQEEGIWRPAAGTFPGWPSHAAEITVMDPCCGSGHFLTEAFGILAALRTAEEALSPRGAAAAVLHDNLFGLEIDGRCVQIAAFAVALAAWSHAGEVMHLPRPHLAWIGQAPAVSEAEWLRLAEAIAAKAPVPPERDLLGGEENLFTAPSNYALKRLYESFAQAPLLGSLVDVGTNGGLFTAGLSDLAAALARTAFGETNTEELALAARGMADAAALVAKRYTLQATNVPFLKSGSMQAGLRSFIEEHLNLGRAQLATAFLVRMLALAAPGGSIAIVTPQNWYSLGSYRALRRALLSRSTLNLACDLGPAAFHEMNWWAARTALTIVTAAAPDQETKVCAVDAEQGRAPEIKARSIVEIMPALLLQSGQRSNPDHRIVLSPLEHGKLLAEVAQYGKGSTTGDRPRFLVCFWELPHLPSRTSRWLDSPKPGQPWSGRELVLTHPVDSLELTSQLGCRLHGQEVWGRRGAALTKMRELDAFLYDGEIFDDNVGVIVPKNNSHAEVIASFVNSESYRTEIRKIDKKLNVTAATLVKVPFDVEYWTSIAAERYPNGLPEPYSDDPTQWLFHGHPAMSEAGAALHVALARLAGYRWPAESDSYMRLSQEAREWITKAAELPEPDADGILCLLSVAGERPLADRLRAWLVAAIPGWSAETERRLVADTDARFDKKQPKSPSLEAWLRDRFFAQHCTLFHQRPFLWQVWDGLKDGFSAIIHYHRLSRATLEKLTYTYLNDWIARTRAADRPVHAEKARELQQKLEVILDGEKPYDIFVRWKPLERQPLGWVPDLDDGVRMNIRPFATAGILRATPRIRWGKDRGRDVASAPWFSVFKGDRINDHHTTLDEKRAARAALKKAS